MQLTDVTTCKSARLTVFVVDSQCALAMNCTTALLSVRLHAVAKQCFHRIFRCNPLPCRER